MTQVQKVDSDAIRKMSPRALADCLLIQLAFEDDEDLWPEVVGLYESADREKTHRALKLLADGPGVSDVVSTFAHFALEAEYPGIY